MKDAEIVVGETYLCYVGAELVPVVVVSKKVGGSTSMGSIFRPTRKERDTYVVRRVGVSTALLPKSRTAAALRRV